MCATDTLWYAYTVNIVDHMYNIFNTKVHMYKCIIFCGARDAAIVSRGQTFFAQGRYRFQYKRPAKKGLHGTLPLAYLCQPLSGMLEHRSLTIHGIGNYHVIEVIFLFKTLLKH